MAKKIKIQKFTGKKLTAKYKKQNLKFFGVEDPFATTNFLNHC